MSPTVKQIGPKAFIIYADDGVYLQTYGKIIACQSETGEVILDERYWDYRSVTTGKYRNLFLNENKRETQRKLNNGTYKLKNLN